jgi:hypothetical protein
MSYAVINGIGLTFGDKKFKFINPYEKDRKETKKEVLTRDKIIKDMEDLKKSFKKK